MLQMMSKWIGINALHILGTAFVSHMPLRAMANTSWKIECTGVCQCSTLDEKCSLKEIFLVIITYNGSHVGQSCNKWTEFLLD